MVPLENYIQGLRRGRVDVREIFAALTWGVGKLHTLPSTLRRV